MSGQPGEPAGDEREADFALRAIAEPRRRAILRLVARDELAALVAAAPAKAVDDPFAEVVDFATLLAR